MNKPALSLIGLLALGSSLSAQNVEVMYLDRSIGYYQPNANEVLFSNWTFLDVGADVVEGSLANFQISNGVSTLSIPFVDEGEYSAEADFDTIDELNQAVPPGKYTFSGTGSSVGAFSIEFDVAAPNFVAPKRVTNFNELQSIDPTKDITIQWEAYPVSGDGYIMVEVEALVGDSIKTVWEAPDNNPGLPPGLPLTATSVTIPANSLPASADGIYRVFMFFSKFEIFDENVGPFSNLTLASLVSSELYLEMHLQQSAPTETWAEWSDDQVDNWIDTQSFLGWIYVGENGWIAPQNMGWIYLPEENVTPSGAWTYLPR